MWREDSYFQEFEARQAALWKEVAELRKLHASTREERDLVERQFHSSQEDLERELARLAALNTQLAVAERQLKEARNEIFRFRRNLSGTKGKVRALDEELANRQEELSRLRREEIELRKKIEPLETNLNEAGESLAFLTREHEGSLTAIAGNEEEKSQLIQEIERLPAFTESERDTILDDLQKGTMKLLDRVAERDRVKDLFDGEIRSLEALRDSVSLLERKQLSLQEAETLERRRLALQAEVADLKDQAELLDSNTEGIRQKLTSTRESLERMNQERSERQNIMNELEVVLGPFDEAVSKNRDAEKRLSSLRELNEESTEMIERMLADNAELECGLQAAQEKLHVMARLAGELVLTG